MKFEIKPELKHFFNKYPGTIFKLYLSIIFLILVLLMQSGHAVQICYADTAGIGTGTGIGIGSNTNSGIDQVLSDIEQHMSNIKTVQTLFVEKKNMSMFDMPVIIKGKIYIENPDKFSWIVTSPVEYTLIINKDTIIKRDKSNGTKTLSLKKNPMFKAVIEKITFWFSGAYASCKKDYDIELIKKEPAIIKFVPKKNNPASKMLDSITLFFQMDKRYISEIRLVEKNTDSTELFFKDVKINSKIDRSVWKTN